MTKRNSTRKKAGTSNGIAVTWKIRALINSEEKGITHPRWMKGLVYDVASRSTSGQRCWVSKRGHRFPLDVENIDWVWVKEGAGPVDIIISDDSVRACTGKQIRVLTSSPATSRRPARNAGEVFTVTGRDETHKKWITTKNTRFPAGEENVVWAWAQPTVTSSGIIAPSAFSRECASAVPNAFSRKSSSALPDVVPPESPDVAPNASSPKSSIIVPNAFSPESDGILHGAFPPEIDSTVSYAVSPESPGDTSNAFSPECDIITPDIFSPEYASIVPNAFPPENGIVASNAFSPESGIMANGFSLECDSISPNAFPPENGSIVPNVFSAEYDDIVPNVFPPQYDGILPDAFSAEYDSIAPNAFSAENDSIPSNAFLPERNCVIYETANARYPTVCHDDHHHLYPHPYQSSDSFQSEIDVTLQAMHSALHTRTSCISSQDSSFDTAGLTSLFFVHSANMVKDTIRRIEFINAGVAMASAAWVKLSCAQRAIKRHFNDVESDNLIDELCGARDNARKEFCATVEKCEADALTTDMAALLFSFSVLPSDNEPQHALHKVEDLLLTPQGQSVEHDSLVVALLSLCDATHDALRVKRRCDAARCVDEHVEATRDVLFAAHTQTFSVPSMKSMLPVNLAATVTSPSLVQLRAAAAEECRAHRELMAQRRVNSDRARALLTVIARGAWNQVLWGLQQQYRSIMARYAAVRAYIEEPQENTPLSHRPTLASVHQLHKELKVMRAARAQKECELGELREQNMCGGNNPLGTIGAHVDSLTRVTQNVEDMRMDAVNHLWQFRAEHFPELEVDTTMCAEKYYNVAPLWSERRLDMYAIGGVVSNGAHLVMRATYLGKDCALKGFTSKDAMLDEALFLYRLRNRYIVPVDAIFTDTQYSHSYIHMPYIPHKMTQLSHGISPELAFMLAYGVLRATAHLHACHVVHGDLTAHSFVVTDDGIPILCSFGKSRAPGMWQTDTTASKNASYATPALGCGAYGARDDMYSAGKILQWIVSISKDIDGDPKCSILGVVHDIAQQLTRNNIGPRPTADAVLAELHLERGFASLAWQKVLPWIRGVERGCLAVPPYWRTKNGVIPQRFATKYMVAKAQILLRQSVKSNCACPHCAQLRENMIVTRVERNENHGLLATYNERRARFIDNYREQTAAQRGKDKKNGVDPLVDLLREDMVLSPELNEVWLMHGVNAQRDLDRILENGLSERLSDAEPPLARRDSVMQFGVESCAVLRACCAGIQDFLAPSDTEPKSIAPSVPTSDTEYFIILSRVLLGHVRTVNKATVTARAVAAIEGYHSIVCPSANKIHQDVHVLDSDQAYPEFAIYFQLAARGGCVAQNGPPLRAEGVRG
eukprot:GEMP01002960.1.p1 GENE.GEMP01002960.1~~GEMP01002960.1.p1  ORF type:complete len:1349 (+),score=355.46 GEMP01002960.1:406-4452(+)